MREPLAPVAEGLANLRRAPALILLSIVVTMELAVSEVLFGGHIVLLIETLGFAGGLAAFTAIWAALGLAVLAVADVAWPRWAPTLSTLRERFSRRWGRLEGFASIRAMLAILGAGGALTAAGVAIAIWGGEMKGWTADHRADVATALLAALVIFVILAVVGRVGRGLANWVRTVADKADPITRSLGALVSMIVLGPALGWPLFRLLRYSRRSVYALTLVAAPVFAGVWVPFYGLGVWGIVEGLL